MTPTSELSKMRRFIPAKDKHRLQHVQCQAPEAIHLFLTCRMLSTVAACSVTIVVVLQQTQWHSQDLQDSQLECLDCFLS